jgi:hypothetical protein
LRREGTALCELLSQTREVAPLYGSIPLARINARGQRAGEDGGNFKLQIARFHARFFLRVMGIDFFANCVYGLLTDLPGFLYSLSGPGLQEFI